MSDARWVKFEVNMYDDTKLKIIDDLDNRDSVHYFWTRFLVLTGKINRGGYLYITDNIPYIIKTLAIEFNRSVDEVKSAIKVLKKLEMIEFTEDKVFKIKNWEKHQNVEGMERYRQLNRERVANHRAKKKEINKKNEDKVNNDIPKMTKDDKQNNNEKIDNVDIQVKENASDFAEEVIKSNLNNGNITENDNEDNTNNKCNVSSNYDNSKCNITVTEQIKKENKNKKENKKESKSKFEINNEIDIEQSNAKEANESKGQSNNFIDDDDKKTYPKVMANDTGQTDDCENENINNQDAVKLSIYYENMTGILGGLNIGSLKLAVDTHGYKNVKMAINKALEVNKANMTYINGILKNWRREGYPKEDMEVKTNGVRSTGKDNSADKNEFAGVKPKKPRNLTEAERKKAEETLI